MAVAIAAKAKGKGKALPESDSRKRTRGPPSAGEVATVKAEMTVHEKTSRKNEELEKQSEKPSESEAEEPAPRKVVPTKDVEKKTKRKSVPGGAEKEKRRGRTDMKNNRRTRSLKETKTTRKTMRKKKNPIRKKRSLQRLGQGFPEVLSHVGASRYVF